jgi:hypothetical protein
MKGMSRMSRRAARDQGSSMIEDVYCAGCGKRIQPVVDSEQKVLGIRVCSDGCRDKLVKANK